jgi:hypothetical protein
MERRLPAYLRGDMSSRFERTMPALGPLPHVTIAKLRISCSRLRYRGISILPSRQRRVTRSLLRPLLGALVGPVRIYEVPQ